MNVPWTRIGLWLAMPALAGCPFSLPDPPFNDSAGTLISGRLTVLPEAGVELVIEQELNDLLDQNQFVGRLSDGEVVSVLGEVSLSVGDPVDAFEFVAVEPLIIDVTLSYDEANGVASDLDLLVHDSVTFDCEASEFPGQAFALCQVGPDNPHVGSFAVEGSFVLLVVARSGGSAYQLDVVATGTSEVGDAAPAADAASLVPDLAGPRAKALLPSGRGSPASDTLAGELLVVFHAGVSARQEEAILAAHGLTCLTRSPSGVLRVVCPRPAGGNRAAWRAGADDVLTLLRRRPEVRIAEMNHLRQSFRVPNDSFFNLQWHYQSINLPQAWDMTVGSDDVVVAVVDTGIVSSHPDLAGRLTAGYDFVEDPLRARDGDGMDPDPEDPGDQLGGPGLSSFHGTHVAGTIGAATNNGRGVAGVTWRTRIMPLRAVGAGGSTTFAVSEAIRYAAGLPNASGTLPETPAAIINISLGGRSLSDVEREAIEAASDAGLLIVAAAGNEHTDEPRFPAALPEVIAVSAVGIQSLAASYSNFGPWIELAAPGGFTGFDLNGDGFPDGVLSTSVRDFSSGLDLRYTFDSGTSMAAPHVTGVAALVLAANPALTATEVREILALTAKDLGDSGRDDIFGHGLVDAAAAVREARARAGISVDTSPLLSLVPDSLDFGFDRNELRVHVFNAGGGFLSITSVAVRHIEGEGWLRASQRGTSSGAASADEVVVTVNRAGQPDGLLRGEVTVTAADGSSSAVAVVAMVGQSPAVMPTISVIAMDAGTGDIVARAETSEALSFEYAFNNLAPGRYVIVAGTDRNDDGNLCEFGDLCGAWPFLILRIPIELHEGDQVTGIDFPVTRRLLRQVRSAPGG